VQRHPSEDRDPTIVLVERYAFDMSRMPAAATAVTYSVRERYSWELFRPTLPIRSCSEPGQFRAELHRAHRGAVLSLPFMIVHLRLSRRPAHHAAKPDLVARIGGRGVAHCA